MIDLRLGDCLSVMATLPENSVDTIITDPPYGLTFMGKDWDRGVPGVAFWEQALRVAKPGGILLAMGGTRTFHRLVCAIEDAGWEVRDSIAWLYGSGFPKSYDISKGIEARLTTGKSSPTAQRMTAMGDDYEMTPLAGTPNYGVTGNFTNKDTGSKPMVVRTTEAQLWHGWGTALKPAMELICVAMKPIDGGFVHNALTWGVAGFWIDGGRVEGKPRTTHKDGNFTGNSSKDAIFPMANIRTTEPDGRFPANVIHDGSDEVTGLFPMTKSGAMNGVYQNTIMANKAGTRDGKPVHLRQEASEGSAARFFYTAKASRSERNAGLEGMPDAEVQRYGSIRTNRGNGYPDATPMQNHHPTVKPLALMRYLARLTKTPTGGVVLDPFMGSGTTGMAAVMEGRDFVGIELNAEYLEIAEKRIAHAQGSVPVELPLFAEAEQ